MPNTGRLVIVGAGQAAFAAAAKLRALKDDRPITIIGAEDVLPYQRPPLSKKYLLGDMSFDRLLFRPEQWYADNRVEFHLSTWVEEIRRERKQVLLHDGTVLDYGTLLLATGSTPRQLPAAIGGTLKGVHVMRDKRDADHLAEAMLPGRRVLIIGGGYIGLEAAAVARHRGMEVTLIEMADRILQRTAARETADIIRAIHQAHDVVIREKTGLDHLIGRDGQVTAARLSDGTVVDVDCVIVGIGVVPNDQLADVAGLEVKNGIVVDEFGRTSDPSIFAAGDCASLPWQEGRIRFESVQNAVDQAEAIALVIAGGDAAYRPKPWFWSDQYDVKLQIAGFNLGYDQTLLRADGRKGTHSVWYFKSGAFVSVDAINDATAYIVGRKMLELGINPDKGVLADPNSDLKQLLRT
ncbi:FAD-dependent oxidoreductase [Rhizobium sp. P44RR-XXIV]|uniref:NAD(P)/FAD-dependent oxidoreductase n=1 Tax=Rhizobium sp. P44RR-XXIV TaxID=1921145 RepID=UPI000987A1AC|nr:FAD-dependent oxidoreductase [Rhizobium sp. P44RR-XXIV]TIX87278.1 pyridine nucleotide-disulfide oxidoreductase [Rhizobium sp. P44RR-XXIV]